MYEQSLNELLQYVHYIADLLFSVSILLYILEQKKKLRGAFFDLLVCMFFFIIVLFFIYFFLEAGWSTTQPTDFILKLIS